MSPAIERNERQAHGYAEYGWPVFPLAENSKVPAIPSAHEPGNPCRGECGKDGHGFWDATTEHAKITGWWKGHDQRNVGIPTGARTFNVLDVDKAKGDKPSGYVALNELQREGLVPEHRSAIQTPSGGLHLIFKGDEQNSGRLVNHSLDHRAEGGYVVALPSAVDGKRYEVVDRRDIQAQTFDWSKAVAHLEPERAARPVQHSKGQPDGRKEVEDLAKWLEAKGESDRNGSLFWASCRIAEHGQLDADARDRLIRASEVNGLRGGRQEAERTIASAERNVTRGSSPKAPEREAGA